MSQNINDIANNLKGLADKVNADKNALKRIIATNDLPEKERALFDETFNNLDSALSLNDEKGLDTLKGKLENLVKNNSK